MASYKTNRAEEDIKRELTDIMRGLKDPRLDGAMLSIVGIHLTNDYSYCTVYISSLEGIEKTKEAVKGLESASGYIRREIGQRVKIRKLPQFTFVADDGIEYSSNLNKLMHELNHKPEGETDED